MDPSRYRRGTGMQPKHRSDTEPEPNISDVSGAEQTPENHNRDAADGGNPPQAADRQPRYSGGYTVIPPNVSRRSKMQTMAQKEMEDLQRWKEANRPSSVHVDPERLGGNRNLAEVRQMQYANLRCSKMQNKLKKEDLDKKRRQEEEEAQQKKKDEQREKANRLEERRQQEERRRREQHRQDHLRTNENLMQRLERSASGPLASGGATHTSSRESQHRESKTVRDVELDHKRVNSAFLDKLEGRGSRKETTGRGSQEAEHPGLAPQREPSDPTVHQLPAAHLNPDPDPEQSFSGWSQEVDPEPDFDWALMKLMNKFPACCRAFLEDILIQCDGDYEQAYTLLCCTLS